MPLTENRTILERLARWRSERPVTGALLLWAASALLALIAVHPATIQITDTSLRTPLAVAGALVAFTAGFVALARPHRSTAGGTLGAVTVLVAVPAVVALGSVAGMAEMLGATVLFGGAGGVACVSWRPDRSPSRSVVTRHAGTVAVLFALLVVVSSGAATAGQFPRQLEEYGGIMVKLDTLSAEKFDSRPNCRALIDDCNNITINGRRRQNIPVARLKLTGISGSNVVISENLQQRDGSWINVQIRGSQITQTGNKGFDAYVSEYYSDYVKADLTALGISVPIDEIKNRWLCNPQADANRNDPGGFGTLDDTRLGIDATPALRDGEDVYQLAHQIGTSNTVIQDFELEVNNTRDQGFQIDKDQPNFPDECAGS